MQCFLLEIREFQPGVGAEYFHLPGETIDKTDPSPVFAAERGLLEETGYAGEQYELLSTILQDSSRSDRKMSLFAAINCVKRQAGENDIRCLS